MRYKLICMDMDGTLLDDYKNISEINKAVIKKAYNMGAKIVVSTGRIFTSAEYFASLLDVKAPVISSNGAFIREKDRNKVVFKNVLGYDKCIDILKVLKKYDIYPHYYTADTIFTEKIIYSSHFYTLANKVLPEGKKVNIVIVNDWEEIFNKYKYEILKCVGTDDDLFKVAAAKKELINMGCFEVVSSYYNNFEVMCKGVSKGKAVQTLGEYYNISREEIICIGDSENDLSMIQYAGLGVAMGNADEFIKRQADYITDSNNNNGVAKVIEKFVFGNSND